MGLDHRTFSAHEREAIISAVEHAAGLGKSVGDTARDHGITGAIFYRWIRERARGGSARGTAPLPAPRLRRKFTREDKADLIAEMHRRRDRGESIKDLARALGLHENSCYRWLREEPPMPFRAVEIADPVSSPAPAELCLVAPSGHRIEGLDVETAAQLLRALA